MPRTRKTRHVAPGFSQRRKFLPQTPARQVRERGRVGRPLHQGVQHRAPTGAHDVGGDTGEFEARVLQHLAQPVHFSAPIADLRDLIAREVSQFSDRRRRHEARLQQAAFEQLRQPLTVLDVGLPPRHMLQHQHVDQQQLKPVFEHVVDRLPVDPGAFQRDMRHPMRMQPVPKRDQIRRHGAERLGPTHPAAIGPRRAYGRDDRRLVHIQTRDAIDQLVHGASSGRSEERGREDSARRARSNNTGFLNAPASDFVRTRWYHSPATSADRRRSVHIFMPRGGRRS
jgi:hypothetical protein